MPTASEPLRFSAVRFSADRKTIGGITFVTIRGTLNQDFEGKKLASSFRTKKVVIDARQLVRFASWGMQEWMGFLEMCSSSDLYLVACAMYAVSQLNLVTGLLGHAKLVSFSASYRCAACGEEIQSTVLIPRDRDRIREMRDSSHECPTCGGNARLETYPAAFFEAVANRAPFDIDDEVLAFLRTRYRYELSPDLARFRAFRKTHKRAAYIRLSGQLASLRADTLARATMETTVVDLAHVTFARDGIAGLREFVATARGRVKSLQLMNCPPGFLEVALQPSDFRDKLSVRSFATEYDCASCGSRTIHTIDVATNLEELVQGVLPPTHCGQCKAETRAIPSVALHAVLQALPARLRDVAVDSFLSKSLSEPLEKLENCLDLRPPSVPASPSAGSRSLYVIAVIAVIGAGTGVAALAWSRSHSSGTAQPGPGSGSAEAVVTPPRFTRPDWILAASPSSGYCHEMVNRVMCIGVSAYRSNRDDAIADAGDVALEQLVNDIALRITDATFNDEITPLFSGRRSALLSELQTAEADRHSDAKSEAAFASIDGTVRDARKRVVAALRESGGPAVPAQRSDWYWEEYANDNGKGTEFLVFIRFDVPLDAVRTLVDKYSTTTTVLGSAAMTAFPALAWAKSTASTGALLANVHGELAQAGITAHQVVVAVNDKRVIDARSYAKAVDESTGDVKLTLSSGGDTPTNVVTVKRPR